MGVKTSQYVPQLSQDTTRGPSQALWYDFVGEDGLQDRGGGISRAMQEIWDDFSPCPTPASAAAAITTYGMWAAWAASGSTFLDAAEEGGVVKINGTTANKSAILTSNAGSFRFIGASTGYDIFPGKFWMEMRIALGSVAASQQGVFFGLADCTGGQINASDTTIIASGANTLTTTKNIIGLFNRTTSGPADFSVVYQPAAGTAVYPTGLTTLVNSVTGANMKAYAAGATDAGQGTNFVKIGMKWDRTIPAINAPTTCPATQTAGNLYQPALTFYVNGQRVSAFIDIGTMQATTFPTNAVFSPVFNYMNEAGSSAPVYLDWMRFGYAGNF